MVSVSKYLKDTEDTAPHVSVSVSQIHFKSIFPNPAYQVGLCFWDRPLQHASTEEWSVMPCIYCKILHVALGL